jgi:hypothetical protein
MGWTEGFEPSISWATTRCLRPLGYAHHGLGPGCSRLEVRGSKLNISLPLRPATPESGRLEAPEAVYHEEAGRWKQEAGPEADS